MGSCASDEVGPRLGQRRRVSSDRATVIAKTESVFLLQAVETLGFVAGDLTGIRGGIHSVGALGGNDSATLWVV
jgi:hypothetical protein